MGDSDRDRQAAGPTIHLKLPRRTRMPFVLSRVSIVAVHERLLHGPGPACLRQDAKGRRRRSSVGDQGASKIPAPSVAYMLDAESARQPSSCKAPDLS